VCSCKNRAVRARLRILFLMNKEVIL